MMSMGRVISCVVGKGRLLRPVFSLDKTLLAYALLHFVLRIKLPCYSRYLLTFYFCIPISYDEKDIFFFFFLVLAPKGVVGLHVYVFSHSVMSGSLQTHEQ